VLDDNCVLEWIKRKSNKYTSPGIQNEMLEVMSKMVLHKIITFIQNALFYAIMVDETTDTWKTYENFIGLYSVPSISTDTLTIVIKDCQQYLNLPISKNRRQCYNGASKMTSAKKGVAKEIQDVEKEAIFIHCYGHALNLECSDVIKGCNALKSALDTTQ